MLDMVSLSMNNLRITSVPILAGLLILCFSTFCQAEDQVGLNTSLINKGYSVEKFSPKQLKKWETYGEGKLAINHDQLVMSEIEGSKGFMIVSPKIYGENVVISYDVLVLRAASVLVTDLAVSSSLDGKLEFPKNYDGNVKHMFSSLNLYMMIAHNAAHNKSGPFIRRYPLPGNYPLVESKKHVISTDRYFHVEAGKEQTRLWYKINDHTIVETEDPNPHNKGKVIIRVRGTAHEIASVLLKNIKIYKK